MRAHPTQEVLRTLWARALVAPGVPGVPGVQEVREVQGVLRSPRRDSSGRRHGRPRERSPREPLRPRVPVEPFLDADSTSACQAQPYVDQVEQGRKVHELGKMASCDQERAFRASATIQACTMYRPAEFCPLLRAWAGQVQAQAWALTRAEALSAGALRVGAPRVLARRAAQDSRACPHAAA